MTIIIFGYGPPEILVAADTLKSGATAFSYHVSDPERYCVVDFDENGSVKSITAKPDVPSSNYMVTELYFVDKTVPERAKSIECFARGELENSSFFESYLQDGKLSVKKNSRRYAWFNTGTHALLLYASNFVRTLT